MTLKAREIPLSKEELDAEDSAMMGGVLTPTECVATIGLEGRWGEDGL